MRNVSRDVLGARVSNIVKPSTCLNHAGRQAIASLILRALQDAVAAFTLKNPFTPAQLAYIFKSNDAYWLPHESVATAPLGHTRECYAAGRHQDGPLGVEYFRADQTPEQMRNQLRQREARHEGRNA